MRGDISKWRAISKKFKYWDTEKARKIQRRESQKIIQWLLDLRLSKYQILEVGCGNGYLGSLIISVLHKHKLVVTYQFTDLVEECLKKTEKQLGKLLNRRGISIKKLDVYLIDKILGPESQEIIISTGFAAAATYKQAVPRVAKALKPEGILICDFVNHLSLPIFMMNFWKFIHRIKVVKNGISASCSNSYHFGKAGIREYYSLHDLELKKISTIGWMKNPLLAMFQKKG